MRRAEALARDSTGNNKEARMAIIAMTTRSSMSVNAGVVHCRLTREASRPRIPLCINPISPGWGLATVSQVRRAVNCASTGTGCQKSLKLLDVVHLFLGGAFVKELLEGDAFG